MKNTTIILYNIFLLWFIVLFIVPWLSPKETSTEFHEIAFQSTTSAESMVRGAPLPPNCEVIEVGSGKQIANSETGLAPVLAKYNALAKANSRFAQAQQVSNVRVFQVDAIALLSVFVIIILIFPRSLKNDKNGDNSGIIRGRSSK